MTGFKASEAVPELAYDFRPFVEAHGVVPEPSQPAMKQFSKAMNAVYGGRTIEEVAKLPYEEQEALGDATKPLVADLCNGHPSLDELENLPFRPLNAFVGWLMGSFQNPTN
jgi:hypothetical protein